MLSHMWPMTFEDNMCSWNDHTKLPTWMGNCTYAKFVHLTNFWQLCSCLHVLVHKSVTSVSCSKGSKIKLAHPGAPTVELLYPLKCTIALTHIQPGSLSCSQYSFTKDPLMLKSQPRLWWACEHGFSWQTRIPITQSNAAKFLPMLRNACVVAICFHKTLHLLSSIATIEY